jgi:hypothetical protein
MTLEPFMRKALALTLLGAAVTMTVGAGAASAACGSSLTDVCSGTTTVAFTVLPDVGSISILPTAVAAGAGVGETAPTSTGTDTAKTATVPLGVTTVLDSRTSSPGWTMSASASDFALAGGGTLAKAKATFAVPLAPVAANAGLLTGALTGATPPTFSARATTPTGTNGSAALLTASAGSVNAAAFVPVMTVDVTGAAAGLYTGTVTQSVS